MNLTMPFNGYERGAPTLEIEEMDARVVDKMACPKCGSKMRYEGHHKEGSYIALAICDGCGHEIAF